MGAAIGVVIVSVATVSVLLLSLVSAPESDLAADCAKFAANPVRDDAEVLAFLAEQRKEYERLDNIDIVARIDEYVAEWEPRRDERQALQARAWAEYEEACLPEPKTHIRRKLVL